eukprot:EG_transcript_18620
MFGGGYQVLPPVAGNGSRLSNELLIQRVNSFAGGSSGTAAVRRPLLGRRPLSGGSPRRRPFLGRGPPALGDKAGCLNISGRNPYVLLRRNKRQHMKRFKRRK